MDSAGGIYMCVCIVYICNNNKWEEDMNLKGNQKVEEGDVIKMIMYSTYVEILKKINMKEKQVFFFKIL